MKIIVAGSRNITNKNSIFSVLEGTKFNITELVSGGARGVDSIAEDWAQLKGISIRRFLPNYNTNNPRYAPLLRNVAMADYADGLIAIWDGQSKGTLHMINTMDKLGKTVEIWKFA
jgi:hypothetical protein